MYISKKTLFFTILVLIISAGTIIWLSAELFGETYDITITKEKVPIHILKTPVIIEHDTWQETVYHNNNNDEWIESMHERYIQ